MESAPVCEALPFDPLVHLPRSAVLSVMKRLDVASLGALACVSLAWASFMSQPTSWAHLRVTDGE